MNAFQVIFMDNNNNKYNVSKFFENKVKWPEVMSTINNSNK